MLLFVNKNIIFLMCLFLVHFVCIAYLFVYVPFGRYFPNSGQLITFTAFIFNMLEGLIFGTRFFTKRRFVPLRYACIFFFLFCLVLVSNMLLGITFPY